MFLQPDPGYKPPPTKNTVILQVYDVSQSDTISAINKMIQPFGAGAYHSGIEVYGAEWSYGGTEDGTTGVFHIPPSSCPDHKWRECVNLGPTRLQPQEVRQVIMKMQLEWNGGDYHLLQRNCCHFTAALAEQLGCRAVPSWVNSLASTGAQMTKAMQQVAADWQLEEKANAVVEAAAGLEKIIGEGLFGKARTRSYAVKDFC